MHADTTLLIKHMIEQQANSDWGKIDWWDVDTKGYERKYNEILFEKNSEHISGVVLDIGAGRDDSSRYEELSPTKITYVAVDIADKDGVDVRGDARRLPFETDSVDTVVVSAMLYQIPLDEVDPVLQEIRRVLKPDGTCLGWVPFVYQLHSQPRDYYRPSQFGMETAFETAGFRDVTVYAAGYFHQFLLQVLHGEYVRLCAFVGLPRWSFLFIQIPVVASAWIVDTLARSAGIRRPWRQNWPVGCFIRAKPHTTCSDKDV